MRDLSTDTAAGISTDRNPFPLCTKSHLFLDKGTFLSLSRLSRRTFWQDFFHVPIYYKEETKFCLSLCKSVCVHAHAQTKRPTALKFVTEILERVFEKTWKRFFF